MRAKTSKSLRPLDEAAAMVAVTEIIDAKTIKFSLFYQTAFPDLSFLTS